MTIGGMRPLLSCIMAGALAVGPAGVSGQQQPDTLHEHGDTLTRNPIQLEAITVTAAPAKREQPIASISVSPAVIHQTPATDPYDLLRQTAGIEVHEQGQGPGFASDASLRGFSSDHSTDIALWVDGVPNNEPVNGHAEGYNDWSLLFPQAIKAIDVLKGPTSAVYGNFAFAGVVNVQTLERMHGTTLWLDPGSYGHVGGTVLTGYNHGRDGGVFGVRAVHQDGWRPNSAYDLDQGHARVVQALSPSATLDAGMELYHTNWSSPGFLSESAYQSGLFQQVANRTDGGFKNRAQERVSLKVLAGPSLLWRTTLYSTQGRWQLYLTIPPEPGSGEGTGSQTEEEDRRYGFGLTSALTWYLPRAQITVGTEDRFDHAHYENWLTTDRVRNSAQALVTAHQTSGALFIQSEEDLGRRLRLRLGGRLDYQNTSSTPDGGATSSHGRSIFSPKLGVLYRLPALLDLYANVSRGFRSTDGVIEDPSLPFITEWAYETGVKLEGNRVHGSVALFRMDVSNEQTFDPITLRDVSGGRSRRDGVEVQGTAELTAGLRISTDWTFTNARYQQLITADGDTLNGARVFNTAQYTGVASVEVAPGSVPWRLRVGTNVVGPYSPFDEPGVVRPPYGLLQVSGGYQVGPVYLQAGIHNLLDTSYRELEAGGFVAPGAPREVYATLRYHF